MVQNEFTTRFGRVESSTESFDIILGKRLGNRIKDIFIPRSARRHGLVYKQGIFTVLQDFLREKQFSNIREFFMLNPEQKRAFKDSAFNQICAWVEKCYQEGKWDQNEFPNWGYIHIASLMNEALRIISEQDSSDLNLFPELRDREREARGIATFKLFVSTIENYWQSLRGTRRSNN